MKCYKTTVGVSKLYLSLHFHHHLISSEQQLCNVLLFLCLKIKEETIMKQTYSLLIKKKFEFIQPPQPLWSVTKPPLACQRCICICISITVSYSQCNNSAMCCCFSVSKLRKELSQNKLIINIFLQSAWLVNCVILPPNNCCCFYVSNKSY